MQKAIVAVGSMAFDTIETPFGKMERIPGGSANYFSIAASHFTKVRCVSVVGKDYPVDHLQMLQSRGVDISCVKIADGKTFHWSGSYGFDLNEATTKQTDLNVFETFSPTIPESFSDGGFVFLGNISPGLQTHVLEQASVQSKPAFVALDTMNFWISGDRRNLVNAIKKVDCLIINEAEVRQLTETQSLLKASETVKSWGPKYLVVKRGEYGSMLLDGLQAFFCPGIPLHEVKDPTGAGDTFAGAFMGRLASRSEGAPSSRDLREALIYGNVLASFTVEGFGFSALTKVTKDQIQSRYEECRRMVSVDPHHS